MSTATLPVVGAKPGATVQVVPGTRYVPLPYDAAEPICILETTPLGGGAFRYGARVNGRQFACTKKNLHRLGIDMSTRSLCRLIEAGFVAGQKSTPGLYQFDYHSLREHERRVAADPEFWSSIEPGQTKTNYLRMIEVSNGRSLTE